MAWGLLALWFGLACTQSDDVAPLTRDAMEVVSEEQRIAAARKLLIDSGVKEISWVLTPYLAQDLVREKYGPMVDYLARRLGLPFHVMVGDDYGDVEALIASGTIDLAVLAPYSYVRVKDAEPRLRLLASHVALGSPNYGAYIITREEADIRQMEQLKGKRFGFVDAHSTSGWLFPAARMLKDNVHPLNDVEAVFLGSHDRVVEAVLSGEVDVGATFDEAISDWRGRSEKGSSIRVIAKTRRIPYDAYVARPGFPPEASAVLEDLLCEISMATPEGRKLLTPLRRINGLMPTNDSHYDVIREVEAEVRDVLGQQTRHFPQTGSQ